jgi:TIR domain
MDMTNGEQNAKLLHEFCNTDDPQERDRLAEEHVGGGVPDNFIEYMASLTGKTIEFYSCFISYSTKDQDFADRLDADLQNNGVRCWFAPHDIRGGKKIHEQIDAAIRMHERLLLILSVDSMKSPWVKTEIHKARKREIAEKRRILFPVSIVPFAHVKA